MKFEDGYMTFETGDLVYVPYTPSQAGKVIRVIRGKMKKDWSGRPYREADKIEVKWLNKSTSVGLERFQGFDCRP